MQPTLHSCFCDWVINKNMDMIYRIYIVLTTQVKMRSKNTIQLREFNLPNHSGTYDLPKSPNEKQALCMLSGGYNTCRPSYVDWAPGILRGKLIEIFNSSLLKNRPNQQTHKLSAKKNESRNKGAPLELSPLAFDRKLNRIRLYKPNIHIHIVLNGCKWIIR